MQQSTVRRYLAVQRRYAGDVSARSVHAGDKSGCDRIGAGFENDRDGLFAALAASADATLPGATSTLTG